MFCSVSESSDSACLATLGCKQHFTFWTDVRSLPDIHNRKDGETNLNIDRGKSRLGHFLFVFHDGDWLDNLVGRGPHAWVERGQSHGNHRRDKSGISAEIVSVKGGGAGRREGLQDWKRNCHKIGSPSFFPCSIQSNLTKVEIYFQYNEEILKTKFCNLRVALQSLSTQR